MSALCPHCQHPQAFLLKPHIETALKAYCERCKRMWLLVCGYVESMEGHVLSGDFTRFLPNRIDLTLRFHSSEGTKYVRRALVPYDEMWCEVKTDVYAHAIFPLHEGERAETFSGIYIEGKTYAIRNVWQWLTTPRWLWWSGWCFGFAGVAASASRSSWIYQSSFLLVALPFLMLLWGYLKRFKAPKSRPQADGKLTPIQEIEKQQRALQAEVSQACVREGGWEVRIDSATEVLNKMMFERKDYAEQIGLLERDIANLKAQHQLERDLAMNAFEQIEILEVERGKLIVAEYSQMLNQADTIGRSVDFEVANEELRSKRQLIAAESDLSRDLDEL